MDTEAGGMRASSGCGSAKTDPAGSGRDLELALEAGLTGAFPGLEILDRNLKLGDGATADIIGVDGDGRLVLVLFTDGDGPEPVLGALDALAYARDTRELLAQHFAGHNVAPDREPTVVLVADAFSPLLVNRLYPMLGDALHLFEVRELETAGRATSYLVPVGPEPELGPTPKAVNKDTFLAGLPEDLRETATAVVRRMDRVDTNLACTATDNAIEWRYDGQLLCTLARVDGGLEGASSNTGSAMGIDGPSEVDALVDQVLARYVDVLEEASGAAQDEDEEGLAEVEIVPQRSGATLTQEEIDAFR